jgi:hypothetical protein
LLANTDHLFAFDASAQDALVMSREMGDGITQEDIISLDNYECYAKLSLQGARLPAFSLHVNPPPSSEPSLVTTLQTKSAQKYGRPAEVVDRMLTQQDVARGSASNVDSISPEELWEDEDASDAFP